jgi:hypothetical protein
LCEFVLQSVITRIVDLDPQPTPNVNSKLLEVGLKVLHSSWKALIAFKWPDHSNFTTNLIEQLKKVSSKFPLNDVFRAQIIKL